MCNGCTHSVLNFTHSLCALDYCSPGVFSTHTHTHTHTHTNAHGEVAQLECITSNGGASLLVVSSLLCLNRFLSLDQHHEFPG